MVSKTSVTHFTIGAIEQAKHPVAGDVDSNQSHRRIENKTTNKSNHLSVGLTNRRRAQTKSPLQLHRSQFQFKFVRHLSIVRCFSLYLALLSVCVCVWHFQFRISLGNWFILFGVPTNWRQPQSQRQRLRTHRHQQQKKCSLCSRWIENSIYCWFASLANWIMFNFRVLFNGESESIASPRWVRARTYTPNLPSKWERLRSFRCGIYCCATATCLKWMVAELRLIHFIVLLLFVVVIWCQASVSCSSLMDFNWIRCC